MTYPLGTALYPKQNDLTMWVRTDEGWYRVSLVTGLTEPTGFDDDYIESYELGTHPFSDRYTVVRPPGKN